MGAARIAIIIVACVAAIGLAIIVRNMMAGDKAPAPVAAVQAAPAAPMTQVLVAKRDLPVGTRIAAGDLDWQAWPVASLNPAFFTNGAVQTPVQPTGVVAKAAQGAAKAVESMGGGGAAMEAFYDAIVREPVLTGEPLTSRKIIRGGEGGYMSVLLTPGMRAVSVPVTAETGVAGFIMPGDRVDLLQSREVERASSFTNPEKTRVRITDVIIRNARVLALDQKTVPEKDAQSIVATTVTLEVPTDAVAAVVEAKAREGKLDLTLRSYADMAGSASRGPVAAEVKTHTVRVFRNGQASEVAVAQ